MKQKSYANVFEDVAARKIPADLDLTGQIMARLNQDRKVGLARRARPVTVLLIVLLALLALTGVAFAFYRLLNDPGIQSILDAGLAKPINTTALPTLLPTRVEGTVAPSAVPVGLTQTRQGVTVTLKWIYLDQGRLALELAQTHIPAALLLEPPIVNLSGSAAAQATSWSFRQGAATSEYVAYQPLRLDQTSGKVDIIVDVPLARSSGDPSTPLDTFHFAVKDVPVYPGIAIPLQQTYSVKASGVEIRLKSVAVMPTGSQVVACFDLPNADPSTWTIGSATLQAGDMVEPSIGSAVAASHVQILPQPTNDHCVRLDFPISDSKTNSLVFRVLELDAPGQTLTGPWEFYIDLASPDLTPGQPTPTPRYTATPSPLGVQSLDGTTMTLDWVFADARRIAVGYTLNGLPDVPQATELTGGLVLKDAQGQVIATNGGWVGQVQRVEGQPGAVTGTWSMIYTVPLFKQTQATFSLELTLGAASSVDPNGTILGFFLAPAGATPFPPGVVPPSLPDHAIGAFHFDFTVPIFPQQTLLPEQTVTANGIDMTLKKIEMTPSYARATLCYHKPSAQDWMVAGISDTPTLEFAGYTANINGYSLLTDGDYGGYVAKAPQPTDLPILKNGRCVAIDFLLGHANHSGIATLTIPALEQSVPESFPETELRTALAKLKAEGIDMDFVVSSSASGGGGSGPVYHKKPVGMTDQEAFQHFLTALGYVKPGPWVFTFRVNQ